MPFALHRLLPIVVDALALHDLRAIAVDALALHDLRAIVVDALALHDLLFLRAVDLLCSLCLVARFSPFSVSCEPSVPPLLQLHVHRIAVDSL